MADDNMKGGPTATEAMFFFRIVQHMKNKGDIDWDGVAETAGFKNAGVARVRFGQIKRKYGLEDSPTKKTGGGKQQVGDLPPTPTKVTKPRRKAGGRAAVKKEESADEEDEDNVEASATSVKEEKDSIEVKTEQPTDGFTYF